MGGMVGGFGAGHDGTEGAGGVGVLGSFPMAAQLIGRCKNSVIGRLHQSNTNHAVSNRHAAALAFAGRLDSHLGLWTENDARCFWRERAALGS
eukprot:m.28509 g.28509  ORF g.28509 m.28509 type:complete len:93 (+) comp4957_c0_seq1:205-483(+)